MPEDDLPPELEPINQVQIAENAVERQALRDIPFLLLSRHEAVPELEALERGGIVGGILPPDRRFA